MRPSTFRRALLVALLIGGVGSHAAARLGQLGTRPFAGSLEHPAIAYATRPMRDPVAGLNRRIESGEVRLSADPDHGYLRAVLDALQIPVESQMLVFSKTGIQGTATSPRNPRALFFNGAVVAGYIRGAPMIEFAAHDPHQGVVFYTLGQPQTAQGRLEFVRRDEACLRCHLSFNSLDVPGLLARSVFTAPDGRAMFQLGSFLIDHRSALDQRWGGWYVTGTHGSMRHMGNATVTNPDEPSSMITDRTLNVESLEGRFDTRGYLSSSSDIVALMVFEHQAHMMNLPRGLGGTYALPSTKGASICEAGRCAMPFTSWWTISCSWTKRRSPAGFEERRRLPRRSPGRDRATAKADRFAT